MIKGQGGKYELSTDRLTIFLILHRQTIEDPDDLDVEVAEQKTGKTRQSRPPRSVLYYLKGYESTISLTPCQLPPRSRILQVPGCQILSKVLEAKKFEDDA